MIANPAPSNRKGSRMPTASKGRPKGSPNRQYPRTLAKPPRCPACQSTDRHGYDRIISEIHHAGTNADGEPYTHVVKRTTRCRACGQYYAVTMYENRTAGGDGAATYAARCFRRHA